MNKGVHILIFSSAEKDAVKNGFFVKKSENHLLKPELLSTAMQLSVR